MTSKRLAPQLALLIAALLPLYYLRFNLMGLPTNFIEILVALLMISTLVSYRRLTLPNFWPIVLIVVGVVLASFFALDQRVAFGIVKGWFVVPLVYYACLNTIFLPEQRHIFIRPLLFSLVLVSLYAIGQYAGIIALLNHQLPEAQQYLDQGRAVGFFESPNFLAMYLVPLTLLASGYFILTKSYRTCWWVSLPIVAIALSQSEAGLLALGAGFVWLWLWGSSGQGAPSRSRSVLVAIGALAVLVALWRWADDKARWYIWENTWVMIKEQPILGIGPGQFQALFTFVGNQSSQYVATLPYALHPHNIFLNFYLSTGLLGLTGFIWLLVSSGREFLKNVVRSPLVISASAGLLAVLVHGLFDSTYFKNDLAIIFWLLVFLMSNRYKESNAYRA
ncbi:MAG: O-antigen ligase family protein [Candidatus Berkelbacteria bacterium]|nr:O-antigen ligase family protein [Candidatus Berkelbacteria bacterium]